MKNSLIITVAGISSRFSQSIGNDILKCIYCEQPYNKSILDVLMEYAEDVFDKIIIVGGYKLDDLRQYIKTHFNAKKTSILFNDHYVDYGSNYSLYLGIVEALKDENSNIVFVEGDLVVDKMSFEAICASDCCVVTSTNEPIQANKSVVFYQTKSGLIKYVYDTKHEELFISEPFFCIANSGQIWKFTQPEILRFIMQSQNVNDYKDTNLNLIQKYFGQLNNDEYKIINIKQWYNCNTIEDYRNAFRNIK